MRCFAIPVLAFGAFAAATVGRAEEPAPTAPFPLLPERDAWAKLPPQKPPALPEWARALAEPLPKTTAKMLELDALHRTRNPLGPGLAARLRLTVATALDCEYGREVARADLARAGSPPVTADEAVAVRFAKKLTLAGHAITDEEFADLLARFGPERTTAIVHTVAYANFHNRIVLALGVKGEHPVAEPLGSGFDFDAAKTKAPERPSWDDLKGPKGTGLAVRVEWSKADFDQLNATLDKQKERKLRIPLPEPAAIDKLPPRERDSARAIRWNTVSAGYQPELTRAWFAALYAFYEESKVDRVFTNSMFWVVTRTNDCFY
jgi:alkylhydroperoxidase family enzyme